MQCLQTCTVGDIFSKVNQIIDTPGGDYSLLCGCKYIIELPINLSAIMYKKSQVRNLHNMAKESIKKKSVYKELHVFCGPYCGSLLHNFLIALLFLYIPATDLKSFANTKQIRECGIKNHGMLCIVYKVRGGSVTNLPGWVTRSREACIIYGDTPDSGEHHAKMRCGHTISEQNL